MENEMLSSASCPVGLTVMEAWRYPVKSMGGEKISEAEVGPHGVHLDRGWAVRDEKLGVVRGARYIPRLLLCSARYVPGTSAGLVPHVHITLPDGETILSDDGKANRRLSDAIGRDLTLVPITSAGAVDRGGPEPLETGDPESEERMLLGLGPDDAIPDMSDLKAEFAKTLSPPGSYIDAFPINILTTSAIRCVQGFLPEVNLNVRRFRPNFLVDDFGKVDDVRESAWIGRNITVGSAEFRVVGECVRCIMVAAEQPDGISRMSAIIRTIARSFNSRLGAYATVVRPGVVRVGDSLLL